MNLRVIASYCDLFRPLSPLISSTDIFFLHGLLFCPQIITDFHRLFFGTEIHGFFKDTAWLRIDIYPRHFVITACFASSRLSLLCGNEPCLYFSIALSKYSLYPSRSPAVLFLKSRVHPCLNKSIINNHHSLIRALGS